MLHLITMPDMWRLFIAIKLAFVWWHQQTRSGRLNPAWTHLKCLWGRREEMKCFLQVPTALFNDTIITRYLPDNYGKCWRNILDFIKTDTDFSSPLPLSLPCRLKDFLVYFIIYSLSLFFFLIKEAQLLSKQPQATFKLFLIMDLEVLPCWTWQYSLNRQSWKIFVSCMKYSFPRSRLWVPRA